MKSAIRPSTTTIAVHVIILTIVFIIVKIAEAVVITTIATSSSC